MKLLKHISYNLYNDSKRISSGQVCYMCMYVHVWCHWCSIILCTGKLGQEPTIGNLLSLGMRYYFEGFCNYPYCYHMWHVYTFMQLAGNCPTAHYDAICDMSTYWWIKAHYGWYPPHMYRRSLLYLRSDPKSII